MCWGARNEPYPLRVIRSLPRPGPYSEHQIYGTCFGTFYFIQTMSSSALRSVVPQGVARGHRGLVLDFSAQTKVLDQSRPTSD